LLAGAAGAPCAADPVGAAAGAGFAGACIGSVEGGGGVDGTALVVSACAARSSSVVGTALARVPT